MTQDIRVPVKREKLEVTALEAFLPKVLVEGMLCIPARLSKRSPSCEMSVATLLVNVHPPSNCDSTHKVQIVSPQQK